ncbi:MAG: hypothetical protein HXS46_17055 [Theionarchaea archaeon]|nr:hypothetical protein [Theionarchaea archaeon]
MKFDHGKLPGTKGMNVAGLTGLNTSAPDGLEKYSLDIKKCHANFSGIQFFRVV